MESAAADGVPAELEMILFPRIPAGLEPRRLRLIAGSPTRPSYLWRQVGYDAATRVLSVAVEFGGRYLQPTDYAVEETGSAVVVSVYGERIGGRTYPMRGIGLFELGLPVFEAGKPFEHGRLHG